MIKISDDISQLNGISKGCLDVLHSLGVYTIMDLASSSIFLLASQIEKANRPIISRLQLQKDFVPSMDLIDPEFRSVPLEQLALKPISIIRSIGKTISKRMEIEMGLKSIADLAKWPAYETAKSILSESAGGTSSTISEDPEMPSDLIPGTGRYPTERIKYDVIVLDKILRKENTSGSGFEYGHGELERPIPENTIRSKPIELEYKPIDVSQHLDSGFTKPALGAVLTYNQSWYTLGLTLGHLLHSVALSPGETTRIAVVDWNRQQKAGVTESISETEALSAQLTHNRAISEITRAVATEAQTGFSLATNKEMTYSLGSGTGVAGEIMSFFGTAGASVGYSAGTSEATSLSATTGRRDLAAEMSQGICDSTQQAANSVRNRRASIVREVSQQESETLSTRAVTNFNHMHALTIQYYEVVQLYRTTVELAKVTRCLLLPMKVLDFSNTDVAKKFRSVLRQTAFSQEIRDLLRNDFSICIQGNSPHNGPSDDVYAKEQVWLKKAKEASLLELSGDVWGQWFVPRVTGIQGFTFTWPKEAKVNRLEVHYKNGDPKIWSPPNPGGDGTAWGHISSLNEFRSFKAILSRDQPEGVSLPIPVEIDLELHHMSRIFNYRHIVKIGQDPTDAGLLGESVTLVNIMPHAAEELVITHLQENALYYSQAIWKNMNSSALVAQFESYTFQGRPISDIVDFTPIATVGNYLAFALHSKEDEFWKEFLEQHPDLDLTNPANVVKNEDIVPIPSGGVFAEAVLGRFNSAEKLDITRFWNWQDSPIPITAPEIAPLQAVSRAQTEDLKTGQLGQPVLNIVNAPSVPDPTGMNAVLNAISNGSMFRDMSNAAQTMTAATELLKLGFMAAGHSQDVAAQYAEQAANLKAGQSSSGKQSVQSSASNVPSNISGFGAKYNAATNLDNENADSGANGSKRSSNENGTTPEGASGSNGVGASRRDQVLGTDSGQFTGNVQLVSTTRGTPIPVDRTFDGDGEKPNGIDVSDHQGLIDWDKVRRAGVRFAFIKATEGLNPPYRKVATFTRNWSGANDVGIIRGAYHYLQPKLDGKAQADYFINTVGEIGAGILPPVIDVEETCGLSSDKILDCVQAWIDTVYQHYGLVPIIYTYAPFWRDKLGNTDRFKDHMLWLANTSKTLEPELIGSWPSWDFWQYSFDGRVDGIPRPVDLNIYNGTLLDLCRQANFQIGDLQAAEDNWI